uniref:Uncharacterized protein n=1 Tax=Anguilla anguilla TaxID=7936 RepID=A0A0E9S4Y1_ANGAN
MTCITKGLCSQSSGSPDCRETP